MIEVTGTEAGLSGIKQIEIALTAINKSGGMLKMNQIYDAINTMLSQKGYILSSQGKSSLRFFINKVAVDRGLIFPHDKDNPGWFITEKGKSLVFGDKKNNQINSCLPTEESSSEYYEGNLQQVFVNKYERKKSAREACISFHGAICKVCSLDFSKKYGDIGKGFIHVHHLVPLHSIKKQYSVDPINDLIPICPNCHSMIHSTDPMLTPTQLREKIEAIELLADLL